MKIHSKDILMGYKLLPLIQLVSVRLKAVHPSHRLFVSLYPTAHGNEHTVHLVDIKGIYKTFRGPSMTEALINSYDYVTFLCKEKQMETLE